MQYFVLLRSMLFIERSQLSWRVHSQRSRECMAPKDTLVLKVLPILRILIFKYIT
eukprot:c28131_g1_i1 orf=97-261(+)